MGMVSIVVTPRSHLTGLLHRTLSRCCEVLCVSENGILLPDMAPDILLTESNKPLDCEGEVVYVFGAAKEFPMEEGRTFGPHCVAVIGSQNIAALRYAARHHLKTLTCGLSSKDTLTLSSLTQDSAMISLQREVALIGGQSMEPADIPIRLRDGIDRNELLMVCAVLILCGNADYLSML